MDTIIEKAQKGDYEAMLTLYNLNKNNIVRLCYLLVLEKNTADHITAQVFKSVWSNFDLAQIHTTQDFTDVLMKKAIRFCKIHVSKKNPKAFRIPANKNFIKTTYNAEKMVLKENACDAILYNLPTLCRFIYILHTVCGYSNEGIAALLNTTSADTIQFALEAESVNIDRIIASATKLKPIEPITIDKFHQYLINNSKSDLCVSQMTDDMILTNIHQICQPLRREKRKKQIKLLAVIVSVFLLLGLSSLIIFAVYNNNTGSQVADTSTNTESSSSSVAAENETYYADIKMEDYGTITVELDEDAAPETVANFISLAETGFYDGLTFHRIIEGFMMQGGDPNGDGTGGSDTTITGEFTENGYDNNLSHTRGAISMARSDDYNSASSQFFIVQQDSTYLDGSYAVFGYVTSGMNVVDAICEAAEPTDDNGTIPEDEQPVISSITIYSDENNED